MLTETIVQTLAQTTPLAIGHLIDFLVESLALRHFAFQSSGAISDPLIELIQQRAKVGEQSGEDRIRAERHNDVPRSDCWHSGRHIGNNPSDDAKDGKNKSDPKSAEPCSEPDRHEIKKQKCLFVTGDVINVSEDRGDNRA